jgi:hypothetical protein
MKTILLIPAILFINACTSMHSNDPDSMFFSIPKGSTMSLNKPLTLSASDTHGVIQGGKEINDAGRNDYAINCRLDFKKFGPRTIEPETFIVTRTEDGQDWISRPSIMRFYTEVYLSSNKDTDVIKLVCQEYGDGIDRNFTVAEMQRALGDFISFTFDQNKKPE